jgi:hypothetical protein
MRSARVQHITCWPVAVRRGRTEVDELVSAIPPMTVAVTRTGISLIRLDPVSRGNRNLGCPRQFEGTRYTWN